MGPQMHWHINCLELLAVHLALNRLKRRLRGEHVLVRTDSTATVAYINRQGGLRSRRMSQLARHLLLWSRKHLRSLRAIHIPGLLNQTANELSRAVLPGEWRLHPQTVQLIWRRFGLAQLDMFASLETSHCQLFYSLTEGTLGTDALAHSLPRGLRKYAFPPVSLLAQTMCKMMMMMMMHLYSAFCVLLYTQSALQSCGGVSPQPPPVCSIHLDDATAATGQRRQCAHHTPATGGEERES